MEISPSDLNLALGARGANEWRELSLALGLWLRSRDLGLGLDAAANFLTLRGAVGGAIEATCNDGVDLLREERVATEPGFNSCCCLPGLTGLTGSRAGPKGLLLEEQTPGTVVGMRVAAFVLGVADGFSQV